MSSEVLKRIEEYKTLAEKVFSTPDGKEFLKLLQQEYAEPSVLQQSTEMTYYKIGQKELVENLKRLAEDEEYMDKISVYFNNSNEV